MIDKKEIKQVLGNNIGVKEGDVVMVHNSYKSIGGVEGGPKVLVDAILEVIGEEGTLLIPTFNFSAWSNEHYFDVLETPSQMGIVTELARLRPDSKRTEHPFYSFAVIGKKQSEYISSDALSALGENSVFEKFVADNGLIISIGLDYNDSFTLVHHVETMHGIDYRRNKDFGGIYMGRNRKPVLRNFQMFVRGRFDIQTKVNPAMDYLHNEGVIKDAKLGDADVKYCNAKPFYESLFPIVGSNPEFFHTVKPRK